MSTYTTNKTYNSQLKSLTYILCGKSFVSLFGTYIPNNEIHVPKYETHVPNNGTNFSLLTKKLFQLIEKTNSVVSENNFDTIVLQFRK